MMFKIRDIESGKFSLGRAFPTFSKNGKAFLSKSALNKHFGVINTSGGHHAVDPTLFKEVYKNCEIVEYEITEIGVYEI